MGSAVFSSLEANKKRQLSLFLCTSPGPPDQPKHVRVSQTNSGYNVNITWSLGRDNYSPITRVIIEQKVHLYPSVWSMTRTITNPKQTRVEVTMSPWAHYTFRAIAVNGIGSSRPSAETATVITPPNGKTNEVSFVNKFSVTTGFQFGPL